MRGVCTGVHTWAAALQQGAKPCWELAVGVCAIRFSGGAASCRRQAAALRTRAGACHRRCCSYAARALRQGVAAGACFLEFNNAHTCGLMAMHAWTPSGIPASASNCLALLCRACTVLCNEGLCVNLPFSPVMQADAKRLG
jgi:hypothetical protein